MTLSISSTSSSASGRRSEGSTHTSRNRSASRRPNSQQRNDGLQTSSISWRGRGSRTLAQALLQSERKVEALKEELESLRRCRGKVFQAPPVEWIQERLSKLKEILERNADRSGLLLRKLLGPLRLEPTRASDNHRPFYRATTSLNTLAVVDPLIEGEGRKTGSNSLQWWT